MLKTMIEEIFSDVGVYDAIRVTFRMAVTSTFISAVLGIVLGLALERFSFPGKRVVVRINRTLMGVPPVVVGLIVYMLTMRRGPLGKLELLFTVEGMILAQTIIITPIICGMIYTYGNKTAPAVRVFAKTMGAGKLQTNLLILREMKHEIYFAIVSGFGRSISEVGAVMLVGGNDQRAYQNDDDSDLPAEKSGDFHRRPNFGNFVASDGVSSPVSGRFLSEGVERK